MMTYQIFDSYVALVYAKQLLLPVRSRISTYDISSLSYENENLHPICTPVRIIYTVKLTPEWHHSLDMASCP